MHINVDVYIWKIKNSQINSNFRFAQKFDNTFIYDATYTHIYTYSLENNILTMSFEQVIAGGRK